VVQKVLRNLLEEGVHLRDMRTDHRDPGRQRAALPGSGGADSAGADGSRPFDSFRSCIPGGAEMQVMSLDPQLERLLLQAVAGGGDGVGIEPGLADTLVREAVAAAQRQEEVGLPMVLLVPGNLRTCCRASCAAAFPN
jgi:flagellar biosynthesis protein FlhA